MLEELRKHNVLVQETIMKSFGYESTEDMLENLDTTTAIRKGIVEFDDELEKAVYADTAQNRRLGRVGQEYHRGRKSSNQEAEQKSHLSGRRSKEQKIGKGAIMIENGNHKYYRSEPYATKSEFLHTLKQHLKETGEKFDVSKLTSKKTVGYDHITRNEYTYTISGNREDEEREHYNYSMKRNEKTTPLYEKYRKQGLSSEEAQKRAFKELGYPEEG